MAEQSAAFVLDFGLFATAIKALPERLRSQLPAEFVAATHIDKEILSRLFDDALSRHLEYESPDLFLFGRLLGLVEVVPQPADPARFQPAFTSRSVRWDRLEPLVTNPAAVMRDVYGWGTPELDSEKLLMALRDLSMVFLAPLSSTIATVNCCVGSFPSYRKMFFPRADCVPAFLRIRRSRSF